MDDLTNVRMRFISLALILWFFIFCSCDTGDIIDLPHTPELTVSAISQDNQPWKIRVSGSIPVLARSGSRSDDFPRIPQANVLLYENGIFLDKLVCANPESNYDVSEFTSAASGPKPGNMYSIIVEAAPYTSVSSSFIQPLPVPIERVEATRLYNQKGYYEGRFRIHFTDPPGENFYEIAIVGTETSDPLTAENLQYQVLLDPAPEYKEGELGFAFILPDTRFANQKIAFDISSSLFNYQQGVLPPHDYYTVYLRNIPKTYYLFLKTIRLQGTFDPYATPARIENNIENGLGIFTGFTQTQKTVYLPE